MLKQKRQLFEFFFMTTDLLVVSLAWVLSYYLRFHTELVEVDKGIPELKNYLSMVLFIWLIWAFVFRRMGLYRPMRGVRRIKEVLLLFNANALALLLFIAVTYLFREKSVPFSRLVFAYFGALSLFFTVTCRVALRFILREVRRRGYNLRYMLIVGAGKVAGDIATRVRFHGEMGFQLVGCLSQSGDEGKGPKGIPIVGKYEDLRSMVSRFDLDQIIVALPLEDIQSLPRIMEELRDSTVDVKIVPDIYQFISVGGSIEEFEGLPVISVQESPLDAISVFLKRAIDLILGFVLLVVLSPLLLLIALGVWLTSNGSILYKQERVSVDGTRFQIYKFRTMTVDAERNGPKWATPGDCRVTKFGAVLRKLSLDELPQLWNVVCGDMSIVGPRPERPVFIDEFRKRVPSYMLRHKVPAGITGWAQVNGWRGDTSIDKRIEYDLYYIRNWSLLFDLKILFLTLVRGFRDRNAY